MPPGDRAPAATGPGNSTSLPVPATISSNCPTIRCRRSAANDFASASAKRAGKRTCSGWRWNCRAGPACLPGASRTPAAATHRSVWLTSSPYAWCSSVCMANSCCAASGVYRCGSLTWATTSSAIRPNSVSGTPSAVGSCRKKCSIGCARCWRRRQTKGRAVGCSSPSARQSRRAPAPPRLTQPPWPPGRCSFSPSDWG
jgi:hypothetical protein